MGQSQKRQKGQRGWGDRLSLLLFSGRPRPRQRKGGVPGDGHIRQPSAGVLSFDFYNESGKLISHNAVVSFDRLERIETGSDFGSRQKIVLAIVPQKGLVGLGGYYEVEVTDAVTFDRGKVVGPDVTPRDTSLVHPGGPLVRRGGALLAPPDDSDRLPTFFPPRATDSLTLPLQLAGEQLTLENLSDRLTDALKPHGFSKAFNYSRLFTFINYSYLYPFR